LHALLASYRGNDPGAQRRTETAETRERLRSLGYLTGTAAPKTRYTEADDPKRLIDIDRAIEDVVSRYQQGDLPGAIALGRDLLKRRPDMPLTLVHLAFLYNEAGDHRGAAEAIRRALALNPAAADVAALAGAYLTEAGLAAEAAALLGAYVQAPDPDVDVLIAYGVALASENRPREALAVFERARSMDTANAMPLVNIGTVHLMAGDLERAARAFTAAVELDPRAAKAHNGLGVIAAERQAYDEAIAHWRQAVAADPRDYQTLYNLGDVLARLGRTAEARTFWLQYVREAPPAETADVTRVRQWLARH
jgi:tetratricopeptide (TPR) repeat protein